MTFLSKWVESISVRLRHLRQKLPPPPSWLLQLIARLQEILGKLRDRLPPIPPWLKRFALRVEQVLASVRRNWPEPPSWRECVKLAIPALVIGTLVRLIFFATVPETYWGEDTQSFWDAARELKYDDELQFEKKRRYVYPVFLMAVDKLPFLAPVYSISLIQHIVGILTIIPFVYIARYALPRSRIAVVLVSLVFAVWYKNLNYENEAAGDALFLSFSIAFTAFAISVGGKERTNRGLFWMFLFGALTVGTKPVGKMVWLGAVGIALLFSRNPLKWSRPIWAVALLGTFFFAYVGDKTQSKWLLLSSVVPLVPLEGKDYTMHREQLRPFIEYGRSKGVEYPWFQYNIKKTLIAKAKDESEWYDPASGDPPPAVDPSEKTRIYHKDWQMMLRKKEQAKPFGALAKEAILNDPIMFARFTFAKMIMCADYSAKTSRLDPDRFWDNQKRFFEDMSESTQQCFEMYLRQPVDQFEDRLSRHEGKKGAAWLVRWIEDIGMFPNMAEVYDRPDHETPGYRLAWFGWAGLFGLIGMAVFSMRWGILAIVPAWMIVGASFAVGDKVSRYAIASDWLLLISGTFGIWLAIWLVVTGIRKGASGILKSSHKPA